MRQVLPWEYIRTLTLLPIHQKKKALLKSTENREWVSILESISAAGVKLQYLVIFKGPKSTAVLVSGRKYTWLAVYKIGEWMNIDLHWTGMFKRIFILKSIPQGQHRLLIPDGHGSYIPIEFMWTCRKQSIHILCLLLISHTYYWPWILLPNRGQV